MRPLSGPVAANSNVQRICRPSPKDASARDFMVQRLQGLVARPYAGGSCCRSADVSARGWRRRAGWPRRVVLRSYARLVGHDHRLSIVTEETVNCRAVSKEIEGPQRFNQCAGNHWPPHLGDIGLKPRMRRHCLSGALVLDPTASCAAHTLCQRRGLPAVRVCRNPTNCVANGAL